MRRRSFIAGSVGAVGALAGCAILGGDGGDGSEPTDPVESLAAGYAANDSESAQSAVHPEGPLANDLPGSVDDRQLELANASVVSETNETATIEATVSVRGSADSWEEPREFEVREHEGDWAVWSMETGPELALEGYFEALSAGRTDDALDRLHADSPDRGWLDESIVTAATPTLESASLESLRDEEATLETTFTETVAGTDGERTQPVELRRSAEGWRVWSVRFGPVVPVYGFVEAIDESDLDAYEAVVHPDSPQQTGNLSESDLERISMSIQSIAVADGPAEGEATVEAELELTVEFMGQEQTETQTSTLAVRAHEGEWLLYE